MNKVLLIIVCGGSGSGKTTISQEIKKILPPSISSQIISMDSYYKKREYMKNDIYSKYNFDHPNAFDWDLLRSQLSDLVNNKSIDLPIYDYTISERLDKTIKIEPTNVIIFEGILSLYDEKIRNMAQIKIFVDTPSDERFIRRLLRDKNERKRKDVDIINQWRNTTRVMHRVFIQPLKSEADIVVPWYNMNSIAIKAIKGAIESLYLNEK